MEKSAQFYLIYPLGLSELGVIELKEKWASFSERELKILEVDPGGILIEVPVLLGFMLNHVLKTPTRILLRMAEFKARDFPKLFQKASKLPWADYLIGQIPEIQVAAHQSKLFDSRKINKALTDGILEYYRRQPIKKRYLDALKNAQTQNLPVIYYRSVEDMITLSLDTTGERLHKRGEKILTGLAPIRENLAALLLLQLTSDLEAKKKGKRTLIDPMCGSGTFLIEAVKKNRPVLEREFSYQLTPDWIDSQFKKRLFSLLTSGENELFDRYIGLDINSDVINQARENATGLSVDFYQDDSFSPREKIPFTPDEEIFMILNPPYGIRVGDNAEINERYYKKLVDVLIKTYSPLRLGIIIPEEYSFFHPKVRSMRAFKNGGIEVVFYVLEFR